MQKLIQLISNCSQRHLITSIDLSNQKLPAGTLQIFVQFYFDRLQNLNFQNNFYTEKELNLFRKTYPNCIIQLNESYLSFNQQEINLKIDTKYLCEICRQRYKQFGQLPKTVQIQQKQTALQQLNKYTQSNHVTFISKSEASQVKKQTNQNVNDILYALSTATSNTVSKTNILLDQQSQQSTESVDSQQENQHNQLHQLHISQYAGTNINKLRELRKNIQNKQNLQDQEILNQIQNSSSIFQSTEEKQNQDNIQQHNQQDMIINSEQDQSEYYEEQYEENEELEQQDEEIEEDNIQNQQFNLQQNQIQTQQIQKQKSQNQNNLSKQISQNQNLQNINNQQQINEDMENDQMYDIIKNQNQNQSYQNQDLNTKIKQNNQNQQNQQKIKQQKLNYELQSQQFQQNLKNIKSHKKQGKNQKFKTQNTKNFNFLHQNPQNPQNSNQIQFSPKKSALELLSEKPLSFEASHSKNYKTNAQQTDSMNLISSQTLFQELINQNQKNNLKLQKQKRTQQILQNQNKIENFKLKSKNFTKNFKQQNLIFNKIQNLKKVKKSQFLMQEKKKFSISRVNFQFYLKPQKIFEFNDVLETQFLPEKNEVQIQTEKIKFQVQSQQISITRDKIQEQLNKLQFSEILYTKLIPFKPVIKRVQVEDQQNKIIKVYETQHIKLNEINEKQVVDYIELQQQKLLTKLKILHQNIDFMSKYKSVSALTKISMLKQALEKKTVQREEVAQKQYQNKLNELITAQLQLKDVMRITYQFNGYRKKQNEDEQKNKNTSQDSELKEGGSVQSIGQNSINNSSIELQNSNTGIYGIDSDETGGQEIKYSGSDDNNFGQIDEENVLGSVSKKYKKKSELNEENQKLQKQIFQGLKKLI